MSVSCSHIHTYVGSDEKKCVGSHDAFYAKNYLLMNFEDKSVKDLSEMKTKIQVQGKVSFANVGKVGTVSAAIDNSPKGFSGQGSYIMVPKGDTSQFVGDFTIEFWVYIDGDSVGKYGNYNDFMASEYYYFETQKTHTGNFVIRRTPQGALEVRIYDQKEEKINSPDSNSVPFKQKMWHYVALVREGVNLYLYQDGKVVYTGKYSGVFNNNQGYTIGRSTPKNQNEGGTWFFGKLDELRVTNGVARYKGGAAFVPPNKPYGVCAAGGGSGKGTHYPSVWI